MSDHLPANQKLSRKDAFYSLALAPLEFVTKSLLKGDPWDLADLRPFAHRCRALADAFDKRIKEIEQ